MRGTYFYPEDILPTKQHGFIPFESHENKMFKSLISRLSCESCNPYKNLLAR